MENKISSIMLGSLSKNSEFEARFDYQKPSLSIDVFQELLMKIKNSDLKYEISQSLDLNYMDSGGLNSYRISVNSLESINKIIQTLGNKSSDYAFKILVTQYMKKQPNIEFMYKDKDSHKKTSFDDLEYNIRFRLSSEKTISPKEAKEFLKTKMGGSSNIVFRFKHRISMFIVDNEAFIIKLDLTSTKQANELNKISQTPPKYELELEFFKKDDSVVKEKMIEVFVAWTKKVLSWLSRSEIFLSKNEKDSVLKSYRDLFKLSNSDIKLYSMQPVTLDLPKLTDSLANNYAVCDKADGEKCGLFIMDNKVYYLSNNLELSYSGMENKKYPNMTYAEGELVGGRFMLFDIFFFDGKDVRRERLKDRIQVLDELIKILNPSRFKFNIYSKEEYDIKTILNFYRKDIKSYVAYLNDNPKVIERKYFIFPIGFDNSEVFAYSTLIWEEIQKGPYVLDGLIYTGVQQLYTTIQKEIAFPILKWKPEELNSIDMYIEFEKNERGEIENVYDNSTNDENNKIFRIANLFVGSVKNGEEVPVPFMKDMNLNQAFFYTDDKMIVRDLQGKIVEDRTVIELSYDSNESIVPEKRWKILRTRYDKTFNMQNYSKQYGNNEFIARKIFDTILNPIRFRDLEMLASDYNKNIIQLRQRVSTKIIEISKQEDAYYQFKSDIAQPLKKFHNFIKDILFIYLYPKRIYNTNKLKKLSVLDFGIGRGGDIMKYYHIRVGEVVGIDPDANGLYNASDSAYSRYDTQRKKKPYFTKMTFIQASAGHMLDYESQVKLFPLMSEDNKKYLKTNFNGKKKFDCISAQFSIHYLFTTEGFNNLVKNINNYLNPDGYFLVTTFDALLVKEFLGNEVERSEYFTDDTQTKRTLFTIKNVSISDKEGLDQAIDFHTSMFMPDGRFETEYLVYPEFFIKQMKDKCGLKLIESLRFKDVMKLEETFFLKSIDSEADERRKKFLESDVKQFYVNTGELHDASVKFSHLNRYYVFQKLT